MNARNLGDILRDQAAANGTKLALTDGRLSLTYEALERLSDNLARQLIADGLTPGERVLVLATKDPHVPLIALAVWKAGGIYVPVDPSQPAARLEDLYRRVEPFCVVKPDQQEWSLPGRVLTFSETSSQQQAATQQQPLAQLEPDAPATLIFTSGSTGMPKGVLLSHSNALHFFAGQRALIDLDASARVINFAPFFFDVSFIDTFLPLATGASVYITRGLPMASRHQKLVRDFQATHLMAIATVLNIISGEAGELERAGLDSLRVLITGAEVLDQALITRWLIAYPSVQICNLYGPTECSSAQLTHAIRGRDDHREGVFPVGRPHSTVHVRLENESGQAITEPHTPGEILIGGGQVMLGYWRDSASTERSIVLRDGVRFYRTGDYAVFDEAGTFHFMGRRDDEVKINGRRINLMEVAAQLRSVAGLQKPHVATLTKGERRYIVAFAQPEVSTEEPQIVHGLLVTAMQRMRENLPDYMVPSYLVAYDEALQTASGKTNFKPLLEHMQEKYVPGPERYFFASNGEFTRLSPAGASAS